MKLLMTADTLGGVWTYCMELCAALAPYEVTISLATMGRHLSPEQRWQVKRLPHVQVHESTYRLCWMQDAWDDVEQAGKWLLSLEEEIKPDIVHLNDLAHGGLKWHTPVVLVAHSCVFSWWDAVHGTTPPLDKWGRYHETVSCSVRNANLVLAPSHAMLKALLRFYGAARTCSVVYNGRDFPPLEKSRSALGGIPFQRRNLTVNPENSDDNTSDVSPNEPTEPFIFAAGRIWDEAKNVGVLSPIVDKLPWPVYAAGEQTDPNGDSNIPEGLNCLGFLNSDEMAQWLRRAGIYVAPAHYEPFGLSILEAARAGCALVLGDIESLREVWDDAAVYVDPDDPEQMRLVLSDLAENSSKRRELAERAWQRAKRYTASRMAASYMQWYRYTIKDAVEKQTGKPMSGAHA